LVEGSGGAKILRCKPDTELLTEIEIAKIKQQDDLKWLEEFFTAPSGSKSTNINYADMELLRSLAPMNGFFIPTERSKSADSWIRWQVLLRIYEIFIQSKSYQKITPHLIKEEITKIKFPLDTRISACLLIVSLNDEVPLEESSFKPVLYNDDKIVAYRIPPGGTLSYTRFVSVRTSAKNKTDTNKTARGKRTSTSAAPATKKVKIEENVTLPVNAEVIVLTGEGAALLVTSDTFSFMTKNLHRPPPIADRLVL